MMSLKFIRSKISNTCNNVSRIWTIACSKRNFIMRTLSCNDRELCIFSNIKEEEFRGKRRNRQMFFMIKTQINQTCNGDGELRFGHVHWTGLESYMPVHCLIFFTRNISQLLGLLHKAHEVLTHILEKKRNGFIFVGQGWLAVFVIKVSKQAISNQRFCVSVLLCSDSPTV